MHKLVSKSREEIVLPHDPGIERTILGSIIVDPERNLSACIAAETAAEDFYLRQHRVIFRQMMGMWESRIPVELVALVKELEKAGELERAGGTTFVSALGDGMPRIVQMDYYVGELKRRANLRRIIEVNEGASKRAQDSKENPDEIIADEEQSLTDIFAGQRRGGLLPVRDFIQRNRSQLESGIERRETITGLATGYKDLDNLLGGFQRGELILLAGRTSIGKTALALSIIENLCVRGRIPCGIFSLETNWQNLLKRLLCSVARVDGQKLRSGFLSQEDKSRLFLALNKVAESPLYLDDTPELFIAQLRVRARMAAGHYGLRLIAVDYLQLLRAPRAENRVQEVSIVSRGLQAMARELEIPVLALCQLSRAAEPSQRSSTKKSSNDEARDYPRLSHLRESGALEQDADVVLMLHAKAQRGQREPGVTEIIVAKQRNGPTGLVRLEFLPLITRFENLSNRTDEGSRPEGKRRCPSNPTRGGDA